MTTPVEQYQKLADEFDGVESYRFARILASSQELWPIPLHFKIGVIVEPINPYGKDGLSYQACPVNMIDQRSWPELDGRKALFFLSDFKHLLY